MLKDRGKVTATRAEPATGSPALFIPRASHFHDSAQGDRDFQGQGIQWRGTPLGIPRRPKDSRPVRSPPGAGFNRCRHIARPGLAWHQDGRPLRSRQGHGKGAESSGGRRREERRAGARRPRETTTRARRPVSSRRRSSPHSTRPASRARLSGPAPWVPETPASRRRKPPCQPTG